MKDKFKGKKVCFVGDSITHWGFYVYNLRAYFKGKADEGVACFNRGIGGNKMCMVEYLLDYEALSMKPDYVFLCYGGNDVGSWLYNYKVEETEEILKERERRLNEYGECLENAIVRLKENKVEPILMTPPCFNPCYKGIKNTVLEFDNDEKYKTFNVDIYSPETYKNINKGLNRFAQKVRDSAKKHGLDCIDIFSLMYAEAQKTLNMYKEDGVHFAEQGYDWITRVLLEYFGCGKVEQTFEKDLENDAIFQIEQIERSVCHFEYGGFNEYSGKRTPEEKRNYLREVIVDANEQPHRIKNAQLYLEYYDELPAIKQKIEKMTYDYLYGREIDSNK